MSTPLPFVADQALTAIAVNFRNPDTAFIADQVMPRVPVMAPEFKWLYFPPEEIFTLPEHEVGRKGRVPEVEFTAQERDSSVKDYGMDDVIPQRDIDAARALRAQGQTSFDPEARAVEGLTHLLQLGRESRVAAMVQDAANYDANKVLALSGTDMFTDQVNSDPIAVITESLDATFIARPNVMAMGRVAWRALSTHPAIIKAINRTAGDTGIASRQAVAELFEVAEVLVGESYLNTAKKGQTAAISRVWGNDIALLHRNAQAGPDSGQPAWGWTATFQGRFSGRMNEALQGLRGSVRIRVGEQMREIVSAPATGFLIQNVA